MKLKGGYSVLVVVILDILRNREKSVIWPVPLEIAGRLK